MLGRMVEVCPAFDSAAEGFVGFMDKGTAGVYLLWSGDEVVYVGQSVNIPQRIASHLRALPPKRYRPYITKHWVTPNDIRGIPIPFNRVLVRWCEVTELDRIERELIQRLRPKYNRRTSWAPQKPVPDVDVDLAEIGLGHLVRKPSVSRRLVA